MINARKLLHRQKVEVRQLEEGLRGSWHSGVVVGVSDSCRDVRYDELLCESGSSKLVESIPVTGAIEGLYQRPCFKSNYRGRIRPVPPHSEPCSINLGLNFGVCVDVLFKEAWWEGVIVDYDEGAQDRRVYFPDEGDERMFKLSDIRVTLEWDEFSGSWRERGTWLLVNLAREHKKDDKDDKLLQLIKRVWSRLKVHYGYQKMISEWTCGAYCVWKEYFREVICDITTKPRTKSLDSPTGSRRRVKKKSGRRSKRGSYLNVSVLTRSMRIRKDKEVSLAVRTRRMCMSDAEDPPISAATNDCHLASFQCRKSHSTAEDSCIITESPKADAGGEYDQIASVCCAHISDSALENREHHGRTAQNRNLHTKSPCCYINNSKTPVKNQFKRKWHIVENSLTPRKPKPSKIISQQADRQTCDGSKRLRQMHDRVSSQVLDYKSVGRRKRLIQTQKKVGFTVTYSILRQGRRRRTSRRSIRNKRSPLRIKKILSRKREEDKLKPTLSEIMEDPKSSRKEDCVFSSQCESTLPATDSCHELVSEDALCIPDKQKAQRRRFRDSVCFICQYGDNLLHCDICMSSYHFSCVDPKEMTNGEVLCPSCTCGLCGLKDYASDDQLFSDVCYQCSHQYHFACLDQAGITVSEDIRFCSKNCFEICARLHQLLRISNPTSVEGLTWSITRSRRNDCNVYNERVHPLIQVSQVLNVFHECFQPIIEPHTGRDLVADIVYNSGSKFRRLDFHGFYVMALVNGDEVVCAATIRIHGQKVAEMPLIATPFKYRRQGMCRLLLHELEKMLVALGVERLVLPGIATLSETWVSTFGFMEMPDYVRRELLGYPFVLFQGTTLFQKILRKSFEVSDKAGPCTPESINANDCATNSSNKCGEQQLDTSRRISRSITQAIFRKNCLDRELPNSKSVIDCKDSPQESMKLDRVQQECSQPSQENCLKNERRSFRIFYKRKRKPEALKKKTVTVGSNKIHPTLKYVYKRRRILASRETL
ncbi:uncharacterized protein LOC141647370 isoform X2 [Silene latifolia]|uniref:uncharacterized protein LOC141647370 isoform X2 n=1 Tax=Silene latifolia TaxID=37657 RepID=UPI003D775050